MARSKIWRKLFIFVLIVGMFSTGVTGYWGSRNAKESLERGAIEHLVSIRDIKKARIESYFMERLYDTEILASSSHYRTYLEGILSSTENGGDPEALEEINKMLL